MSAVAHPTGWISPEEYLEGERLSEVRHEYINGYVYAIAGASDDHNRIAGNIFGELRERLRGKTCEAFGPDMKLKLPSALGGVFYYPDVTVACDPKDNAKYHRERPALIFEVMSPDTERIDRGEKARAYHEITTLKAYILVEQDRAGITVLHRIDNDWRQEMFEGPDAVLKLPGLGIEIPFNRIYERTRLLTP